MTENIPALKDCPHVISEMKKTIGDLLTEIALLQHRVMMLEVANGKYGKIKKETC